MNRAIPTLIALCLLLLAANGWLLYDRVSRRAETQATSSAQEEPELAVYMSTMQRYSHKLMLAAQARNAQATGFYLHELEALSETIEEEVPMYGGHEIAALVGGMMGPALTKLDAALDERQWDQVDARIEQLTTACNQCHAVTDYEAIRITHENLTNPYNQSFGTLSP